MPVLVLFSAEHPQSAVCVALTRSVNVVGRGEGVEIPLLDPSVSRRHVVVLEGPTGWIAKSLNADNLLRVGGQPTDAIELRAGTVFEVGAVQLRFEVEDPRAAPTTSGSAQPKRIAEPPPTPPEPLAASTGSRGLNLGADRPSETATHRRSVMPWVFGLLGLAIGSLLLIFGSELAAAVWTHAPDTAAWLAS